MSVEQIGKDRMVVKFQTPEAPKLSVKPTPSKKKRTRKTKGSAKP